MKLRLAVAAFLVVLLAGAGIFLWGLWATRQVPEFYQQAIREEPKLLQTKSDELLEQATALANSVRNEGRWEAVFTVEQINGWLAVDLVRNHKKLIPPEVAEPRISIRPGTATIACRYRGRGIDAVMSLEVEAYLSEPNVLALRLRAARAGAMPVPLGRILDGISKAADATRVRLRWLQSDSDPVAEVTLLPPRDEDDKLYQLESLELREGAIYVSGRTTRGDASHSPTWVPQFKPIVTALLMPAG